MWINSGRHWSKGPALQRVLMTFFWTIKISVTDADFILFVCGCKRKTRLSVFKQFRLVDLWWNVQKNMLWGMNQHSWQGSHFDLNLNFPTWGDPPRYNGTIHHMFHQQFLSWEWLGNKNHMQFYQVLTLPPPKISIFSGLVGTFCKIFESLTVGKKCCWW